MSEDLELPPGYPATWEADVVLRDGSVAHLRPIVPNDADGIRLFHSRQSAESIYFRFFAPLRELSERDIHRFTNVDYVDRVALVATIREDIVGIGRYDCLDPRTAEVAFNISDHYQGKGIGSVLLEHLAAIGRDAGVQKFTAEVLPHNRKMLTVFSDAGFAVTRRIEDGVVQVEFDIEPTDRSRAVAMSREHRAEALSVRTILHPRSVAVIGASRRRDSIGNTILRNLIKGGYTGEIYPINPNAATVRKRTAYPSIMATPAPVDLAVVAVPAHAVLEVVDECALAGVKALLVVSAGFAEEGADGSRLQSDLVRRARGSGMRVIGPNSFGIANTHPSLSLNASLSPTVPPAGHLGLFAQSGALSIAVLASAARRRLGLSSFASAGNRVDVSGNDFMQYWIDDDETRAVGLYLESMGNPRKFSRIARNLARIKPVIVVKSGASAYGVPPGHRVRKTKARPEVFSAMLRQAGVMRVDNVHQLFDVAQLVVHQPLPKGNRVAVVGNSTALGSLTAEALASSGMRVTHGPVHLRTEAGADEFRDALAAAFADPDVDSVLACFIPPLVTYDEDVAAAVRAAARGSEKPCAATFLGMRGVDSGHKTVSGSGEGEDRAIPVYAMPEDAVRALASATRYGQWREQDHGTEVAPEGINRRIAEDIVHTVLSVSPKGRKLTHDESATLLAAYGVEVWPVRNVESSAQAVAAAEEVGYPVVLKSMASTVRNRVGSPGVRVDLRSAEAVEEAWESLANLLTGEGIHPVVIQRMASPGVPCVVTSDEDPLFGPVLGFSIAGISTDLLADIAYRIPPLTDVTVRELITSIKAAPVLQGHRGATPVDLDALADLISRISVLADDLPEVARLELKTVNARGDGVDVLGAQITLAPAPRRTDPGRRSLT